MSQSVSMAIFAAQAEIPVIFENLLHRILREDGLVEAGVLVGVGMPQHIDVQDILRKLRTPPSSATHSNEQFTLRCGFRMASGGVVYGDVIYEHVQTYSQMSVDQHSFILIRMEFRDLVEFALDRHVIFLPETSSAPGVSQRMFTDVEVFFLDMCGLMTHPFISKGKVDHGVLCLGGGILASDVCTMLYHRDPLAFATDFGRMYYFHNWGITPSISLATGRDVWSLTNAEVHAEGSEGSQQRLFLKDYFSEEYPATDQEPHRQFLLNLDRQTAWRLSSLPIAFVRKVLNDVQERTDTVNYYDFGSRGGVLAASTLLHAHLIQSPPFDTTYKPQSGTTWRAYEAIRSSALRASAEL